MQRFSIFLFIDPGYDEAPEAIAQDMVSGNANMGIILGCDNV